MPVVHFLLARGGYRAQRPGLVAYYVGGIAEQASAKRRPGSSWSIMLFSYAVRAIYIESCSMFVRGGVYKVVHEALGGTLAKFSSRPSCSITCSPDPSAPSARACTWAA